MKDSWCKVGNDLGKNREGMRASGMCPLQLILCLVVHTHIHMHTLSHILIHFHTHAHMHTHAHSHTLAHTVYLHWTEELKEQLEIGEGDLVRNAREGGWSLQSLTGTLGPIPQGSRL